MQRLRRGERTDHFETVRRRKDGSTLDISLTISPVKNAAGAIIGASKIARDISERKRAQTHITMLAREAEHRAKNMLATVEAMVHLTKAGTVEGFKEAVSGRIRELANVHRLFVETTLDEFERPRPPRRHHSVTPAGPPLFDAKQQSGRAGPLREVRPSRYA
jgi:HWE histidine kinase